MSQLDPNDLYLRLREAGLRLTAPRRAICTVLAKGHQDHLNALEIQEQAEAELGGDIDPSTVYRTIDALEKAGALHHIHLAHGPAVVHLSGSLDHHHLVCEICGRTVDLPAEELADFAEAIQQRYDFMADSVHFALVGRCVGHSAPG